MDRRVKLIYLEARRHRALAMTERFCPSDHLEVARALERAAKLMETAGGKRTPRRKAVKN